MAFRADEGLKIGAVADSVGVSRQTLRVWETQGLLVPDRTAGGQRVYRPEHVARAEQITELRRRHGWNPAAIKTALSQQSSDHSSSARWNGAAIRRARRARGLTVKGAAARIGISPSLLSSLERGESGISTQLVARIADAFLVPQSAFAAHRPSSLVVRRADRVRGVLDGDVMWEELAAPGHALEPSVLTAPGGQGSGGSYSRPGETFVFLLSGQLSFSVAGQSHLLAGGDALMVPPRVDYEWHNPGTRPARALWVEQLPPTAWEDVPPAALADEASNSSHGRGERTQAMARRASMTQPLNTPELRRRRRQQPS